MPEQKNIDSAIMRSSRTTPASMDLAALAGRNHREIIPQAEAAAEAFGRLFAIVARLRAPDGCPWDREQTQSTLRGNIVEEAYELVEAIDEKDPEHIVEESGDLYLLATMVAYMEEEAGNSSVAASLDGVGEKLVRRHPHVFGESVADTSDKVLAQWQDIKEKVEGRRPKDSMLDDISRALPPLERAYRIQKKVAKAGFEWDTMGEIWDKVAEEVAEAREVCETIAAGHDAESAALPPAEQSELRASLEGEIGDIIFSVINVARRYKVDPALALGRTVEKFTRRFRHVEKRMAQSGIPMQPGRLREMDSFWNEAKQGE
jgi:tetrapyrrole methylase family protein/MazG family protein